MYSSAPFPVYIVNGWMTVLGGDQYFLIVEVSPSILSVLDVFGIFD